MYAAAALITTALLIPTGTGALASDVTLPSGSDLTAPSANLDGPASPGVYYATGTVTRVTDGDTIRVAGVGPSIRILGIDTPETVHPDEPVQCWGPEATAFARETLADQTVDLYTDPTQATHDMNRRLLAYAVLPYGVNYSVAAASAGAARAYTFNDTPVLLSSEISAAEDSARQAGLGLWGPPCNGVS